MMRGGGVCSDYTNIFKSVAHAGTQTHSETHNLNKHTQRGKKTSSF